MPLLTSTIHYDMFDPNGSIAMRLSFDHRVLDAAAAAGALEDLESVLLSDILRECSNSGARILNIPVRGRFSYPIGRDHCLRSKLAHRAQSTDASHRCKRSFPKHDWRRAERARSCSIVCIFWAAPVSIAV